MTRRLILIVTLIVGLAAPACTGSPPGALVASDASGSSLSHSKDRTLAAMGPYDERRRWQTYIAMSELFDRVWLHPQSRRVLRKERASSAKGLIVELEDRDEDGRAEFYAYLPPDGSKETQDFGAFFDLNGDGRPDWIAFHGGSAFTKKAKLFWWHQHGIDTNGDGRFDLRVVEMIDTDGDGFPEKGATAWVYDTDHDGFVDKAEHIVNGRIRAIKPEDGVLPLGWVMSPDPSKQPRIGGPTSGLFGMIANDINVLLGR